MTVVWLRGLREYSVQPDTLRIGVEKLKGYRREALADAWGRYAFACHPLKQPCQAWQP